MKEWLRRFEWLMPYLQDTKWRTGIFGEDEGFRQAGTKTNIQWGNLPIKQILK